MFPANEGTGARQKDSVVNAEASGEFVWPKSMSFD